MVLREGSTGCKLRHNACCVGARVHLKFGHTEFWRQHAAPGARLLLVLFFISILISFYWNSPFPFAFSCTPTGGWQIFYIGLGVLGFGFVLLRSGYRPSFFDLLAFAPVFLVLMVLFTSRHFQCALDTPPSGTLNRSVIHFMLDQTVDGAIVHFGDLFPPFSKITLTELPVMLQVVINLYKYFITALIVLTLFFGIARAGGVKAIPLVPEAAGRPKMLGGPRTDSADDLDDTSP